ncbi:MAG: hypothetical protein IKC06_01550 [Clostridia bacterium]|nr:hypothetical protein [Clostridia bacterium]
MQTQETKQTYGIKGKLISAVAMLLVAIIMVVSSTYAWFTLSTAPEVTGISTAVGANGALEMLLLTKEGDELIYREGVIEDRYDINTYWGNLVDVSSGYGLDDITLYPSQLSTTGNIIDASIVQFPEYGADGRVSNLSDGAVTGIYETVSGTAAFYPGNGYGVRAVGSSSGMTARQLAYRNALSSAGTNMAQARKAAATALSTNGNAIADIAVRKGTGSDSFNQQDVKNLLALTTALNSVVAQMEESYKQFIIAYAASAAINTDIDTPEEKATKESLYSNVQAWFAENDTDSTKDNTIYTFADTTKGFAAENNLGVTISLPPQVATGIAKLATTKTDVNTAHSKLTAIHDRTDADGKKYSEYTTDEELEKLSEASVAWADSTAGAGDGLGSALTSLVTINAITVSGWKVSDILANKDAFAADAMKQFSAGGIALEIKTGGGVLADIADQCGNYEARITISEITYGVTLKDVPAHMKAITVQSSDKADVQTTGCVDTYLGDLKTAVTAAKAPASDAAQQMPISEFYGYIIDLAFRTNAAESNLLLQTAPKDRIYSDNTQNDQTWGKGSTMNFKATAADFTNDDVKDLMQHIKIVFFNPLDADGNKILAYAKLDIANAEIDAVEGVTADIYLYKTVSATKITDATYDVGENTGLTGNVYSVVENGTTTYYAADLCTEVTNVTGGTPDEAAAPVDIILKESDAVIQALTQNEKAHVSVLVYLDGTTITNADVAATVATSMTGSMNLQFASSATLVPMDYAQYQTQNNNQGGTGN